MDTSSILGWSLALVTLLVLMFGGIGFLRKWMAKEDDSSDPLGFTLGDLRRMHAQGQITDEEFEKAKTQMIAATQRAQERAAQEALAKQKSGAALPVVTDIEELRKRAQRNRANPPPPPPHG